MLVALTLGAAALVAVPATEAVAAANSAAGVGTKAALKSPLCDPTTGKIKIPSHLASACTKAFKKGDRQRRRDVPGRHQGHGQGRGVRPAEADSSSVRRAGGQPPTNRSTGKIGLIEDAVLDAQQALDGRYELWGRKIEYTFVDVLRHRRGARSAPTR